MNPERFYVVGQLVQLKGINNNDQTIPFGPVMRLSAYAPNNFVQCQWFTTDGLLQEVVYSEDDLVAALTP